MTKPLKVGVLFNAPVRSPRGEAVDDISAADVLEQAEAVQDALRKLEYEYRTFILEDDVASFISALKSYKPDVVINLCEGVFGDSHLEMNVPCLLELLSIPYTGSPPLTLGLCQNKGLTKDVLRSNGIPTPRYQVLNSFEEWRGEIAYPLFVKPLKEDASVGITEESYVRSEVELKKRVGYVVERYEQPALVEEYVDGRELNVSVFGNEEPRVLPISEIIFDFSADKPKIVDYSAKWIEKSEEYEKTRPVCPANLEPNIRKKVETTALKTYRALYCRDYARVDIRLKHDEPYVLEANPNPDISPDVGFPRSLKAAGIPYEEFIGKIISFALERKERRGTP